MPSKKIKVIDIEEPSREQILDIIDNDKQEVVSSEPSIEDQQPPVLPSEPVVMKKTRAPRQKKAVVETKELEPIIEITPEPIVEVKEVEKPNTKTVELVVCPKCDKKLTSRTLKYSHESVCPANGEKPSTKDKFKRKHTNREESLEHIIEQYIEHIPALTAYDKRLLLIKQKQDKIKNLAVHAF